jgi:hypothetical protein
VCSVNRVHTGIIHLPPVLSPSHTAPASHVLRSQPPIKQDVNTVQQELTSHLKKIHRSVYNVLREHFLGIMTRDANNSPKCLQCPPGTFSGYHDTGCKQCAPKFQPDKTQTYCNSFYCVGDTYSPDFRSCLSDITNPPALNPTPSPTKVSNCLPGQYDDPENNKCVDCEASFYSPRPQVPCVKCPWPMYSTKGSAKCLWCDLPYASIDQKECGVAPTPSPYLSQWQLWRSDYKHLRPLPGRILYIGL